MSGHGVKHTDWLIRETSPHDDREIREVNRLAFWSEAEGVLVARLRAEGAVILSLLGVAGDRIVGHVLFARVFVRHPAGVIPGVCLAPLAVVPAWRSRGIGSALVRAGLAACQNRGEAFAVVRGDKRFYSRFGFSAEFGRQLEQARYPAEDKAWVAMELKAGSLTGIRGEVILPDAFNAPEMAKGSRGERGQ